jgi:hypothetical protein
VATALYSNARTLVKSLLITVLVGKENLDYNMPDLNPLPLVCDPDPGKVTDMCLYINKHIFTFRYGKIRSSYHFLFSNSLKRLISVGRLRYKSCPR